MKPLTVVIIIGLTLVFCWVFIIYDFKKREQPKDNSELIEYYRTTIDVLTKRNNYLKLKLEEAPKTITKVKTKYETVHDTINILDTIEVEQRYSAELRQYEDRREAYNIARFK